MKIPTQRIEPGFYRHYKYDPSGEFANYSYEVLGIGIHTEDSCAPEDANMVVYRALYASSRGFNENGLYYIRPYEMFVDTVEKNGEKIQRFTKITDPKTIETLQSIKRTMYGA